jgi:hypothetical protein
MYNLLRYDSRRTHADGPVIFQAKTGYKNSLEYALRVAAF